MFKIYLSPAVLGLCDYGLPLVAGCGLRIVVASLAVSMGSRGPSFNSVAHGLPRWLRQWRICLQCRRLPAKQETRFNPCVRKIPWRRALQPTPVCLPGESPWTEEPGRLQSTGSQRVGHDWVTKHISSLTHTHTHILMSPTQTHSHIHSNKISLATLPYIIHLLVRGNML